MTFSAIILTVDGSTKHAFNKNYICLNRNKYGIILPFNSKLCCIL